METLTAELEDLIERFGADSQEVRDFAGRYQHYEFVRDRLRTRGLGHLLPRRAEYRSTSFIYGA